METRHGVKHRQLHIEGYLREILAERGGVTGVYAHEWITGNPDINTDFWMDTRLTPFSEAPIQPIPLRVFRDSEWRQSYGRKGWA